MISKKYSYCTQTFILKLKVKDINSDQFWKSSRKRLHPFIYLLHWPYLWISNDTSHNFFFLNLFLLCTEYKIDSYNETQFIKDFYFNARKTYRFYLISYIPWLLIVVNNHTQLLHCSFIIRVWRFYSVVTYTWWLVN